MKVWIPFNQHVIIVASALCLFLFIALLIWKLFKRPKELMVNCWFCNTDSTVPAANSNCWDCPHCDQYNGFDKEGNYNKAIPAQRYSELNQSVYAQGNRRSMDDDGKFSNILCEQCNQNQQLKVQQLAMFVPDDERTYDCEIEEYAHHLESLYQLCLGCELQTQRKVQNVDDRVHRNLLGKRLLQFRNFTSKKVVRNQLPQVIRLFVLVCLAMILVLDVVTFRAPNSKSEIVGLDQLTLLVIVVTMTTGIISIVSNKQRRLRSIDVVCTLYWIMWILSRLDNVLDRCIHAFPWLSELEMYMNQRAPEVTAAQQKLLVKIMIDVVGCVLAIVLVMKSIFGKETKTHRKNISEPVLADLSRQSSFSSLPRSEVDCSVRDPKQKTDTLESQSKASTTSLAEDHPLNTSLGSLSLIGEAPVKRGLEPVIRVGKERRPLISPAKFTGGDSVRQRKRLITDIETPVSSCASSIHGSVHSTMLDGDYLIKTKGSPVQNIQEMNSSSPFMYMLFGVSVGINITIVIAVILWGD